MPRKGLLIERQYAPDHTAELRALRLLLSVPKEKPRVSGPGPSELESIREHGQYIPAGPSPSN